MGMIIKKFRVALPDQKSCLHSCDMYLLFLSTTKWMILEVERRVHLKRGRRGGVHYVMDDNMHIFSHQS